MTCHDLPRLAMTCHASAGSACDNRGLRATACSHGMAEGFCQPTCKHRRFATAKGMAPRLCHVQRSECIAFGRLAPWVDVQRLACRTVAPAWTLMVPPSPGDMAVWAVQAWQLGGLWRPTALPYCTAARSKGVIRGLGASRRPRCHRTRHEGKTSVSSMRYSVAVQCLDLPLAVCGTQGPPFCLRPQSHTGTSRRGTRRCGALPYCPKRSCQRLPRTDDHVAKPLEV